MLRALLCISSSIQVLAGIAYYAYAPNAPVVLAVTVVGLMGLLAQHPKHARSSMPLTVMVLNLILGIVVVVPAAVLPIAFLWAPTARAASMWGILLAVVVACTINAVCLVALGRQHHSASAAHLAQPPRPE